MLPPSGNRCINGRSELKAGVMPQNNSSFEIFATCPPGLEPFLCAEVKERGFKAASQERGGVSFHGDWEDVWRANLILRGASKVLARIGEFRAFHLAQLDKRARKFPWADVLTQGPSVKVEIVTNKKNKIYHSGAAVERIEKAISEEFSTPIAQGLDDAEIVIKGRIDRNNLILSVDTSGEGLHKRGHKQAMGKAPMRETMAALLLRACGYDGHETVVDPMCGSGTFLIEAAEIASGMMAGRARGFAFEKLASYEPEKFERIKASWKSGNTEQKFYGSDRNVKVIEMAGENSKRAGVAEHCIFKPNPISALERPDGAPGLVIVNPPYGARVGKKKDLYALYKSFGVVMEERFSGWRVGLVTSDDQLAKATELKWSHISDPISHGGLRVKLYQVTI